MSAFDPFVIRSEVIGEDHEPPGAACFPCSCLSVVDADILTYFLQEEEEEEAAAAAAATRATVAATAVEVGDRRRAIDGVGVDRGDEVAGRQVNGCLCKFFVAEVRNMRSFESANGKGRN